jgi:hypothetical protein
VSPSNRLRSSTVHPSGFRTLAITPFSESESESGRRSEMARTGGQVTKAHAALACPASGAYSFRLQSGCVGRCVCRTAVGSSSALAVKWR